MKAFFRAVFYQPLYNIFIFLLAVIPGHNLGVAIIALTFLVRLVLTPIKYKAIESQMHQRNLQPELKRVQKKYKDDKQAQSMAMMQLYKDKGVNPASGCLPLLVQFPILIGLVYVFRSGITNDYHLLYHFIKAPASINFSFLWLKDLTKPDHLYILPVLAGIAQFFYSRSLMASQPPMGGADDMAQVMNKQMTFMAPALTVLFATRFPAALSLYWVAGSLMDWAQQSWGIRRFHGTKVKTGNVTVSVRRR